jgi:peptidoglycan hydrolase CwlO-like protein
MKDFFYHCISYWILGILIVFLGIDIALHISCKVVTSDHIVLTFVGVLATFIVVSNYAKVRETKREFEKKIDEVKIVQAEAQKKLEQLDEKVEENIIEEINLLTQEI